MWRLDRYFPTEQEWIDCYHVHNAELWRLYDDGQIDQAFLRTERFVRPLADAGVSRDSAVALATELDPAYLDCLAEQRLTMPGARELLDGLRALGYRTGVLSNGFQGVQQKKLVSAGLADKIDLVVLSDDIGVNKPDVRLYRHAMERARDNDPEHHLMIGDNPATDICGALNAGWKAFLYSPRGMRNYQECPEIANLTDAIKAISAL